MFETIRKELIEEYEEDVKTGRAALMTKGQNQSMLKNWSTETRWNQYQNGQISEEKARQYAAHRYERQAYKRLNENMLKLDRIESAPELQSLVISVEYGRSWNVSATVETSAKEYREAKAGGYGYDKESSAIASCLNDCDSVLKVLYQYKEDRLNEGQTDTDGRIITGRNNRNIIGYGSGYTVIPYFEGGVGAECFWRIFEKLGYTVRIFNYSTKRPFYEIYKKEA